MHVIFYDKRFSLSLIGISFARVVFYSTYIALTAVTVVLFFSDIPRMPWVGLLLSFFLVDRFLQIGKGDSKIFNLRGEGKNIARALSPQSFRLLDHALRKSIATGEHPYFILLNDLVRQKKIKEVLVRLDVPALEFSTKILEFIEDTKGSFDKNSALALIEKVSFRAFENASHLQESYIEPRNLFAAVCAEEHPYITKLLYLFDIKSDDVARTVLFLRHSSSFNSFLGIPRGLGAFAHTPYRYRKRVMNRAWTARPTPTLDSFSEDLTTYAQNGSVGFMIGHQKEYKTLLATISRPGKPNAILVGDPGIGKSTLIEHLAYEIIKDNIPPILFDKRLVLLRISELVADAEEKDISARIERIANEIILAGNIILVIPNAEDLFKSTTEKKMRPIDYFLPIIKSESIPVICETYPREFKQFIESRTDFLEQFEVIHIEEITEEEAAQFLIYQSLILEREFKITITFKAVRKSIELAHRYFRNKPLPGSAADMLKQAVAESHQSREKILSEKGIISVAERQSKIPIQRAEGSEVDSLLHLETAIHKKLINQKEAVLGIARALREYRSGLARRGGPIATFLFVGPTGVGKTELAKILAEIQFGSRDMVRRFDMSEYQDRQSIFQLIGTPDGGRAGALTDVVLQNPYSLILLDEFEKAHADILNLFLQVFDDGRLTDTLGRTADFQNTIIIATSNAHSEFIKAQVESGKTISDISEILKQKLTDYFKPELINRFSQVVVFRNLNQEETKQVAELALRELAGILLETHGITITVSEEALLKIAELGYNPVFGARPLRQVISEKVRSVLAEKILKKEIARGNVLRVVFENNQFDFKVIE